MVEEEFCTSCGADVPAKHYDEEMLMCTDCAGDPDCWAGHH